jgi:hypothetical protein
MPGRILIAALLLFAGGTARAHKPCHPGFVTTTRDELVGLDKRIDALEQRQDEPGMQAALTDIHEKRAEIGSLLDRMDKGEGDARDDVTMAMDDLRQAIGKVDVATRPSELQPGKATPASPHTTPPPPAPKPGQAPSGPKDR